MDVGGKWKVISEARYINIRFLQFTAFACACSCSCVPFSNHPLMYNCVCDLCQNQILLSRALHMDTYIWCISMHAQMHTPSQAYVYQFITDIKRKSLHILNICRHRTSNGSIFRKSCMSPWPFIHSPTYGNQWKHVLALFPNGSWPKPRFAILTAQGASTCRSEVGVWNGSYRSNM